MDAFEEVVTAIFQRRGFWTQRSVKVELTRDEKRAIERHSTPRWELDIVAYRGASHELAVVECKSLLDSYGVRCDVFEGNRAKDEKRYKLFCNDTLREVIVSRLITQLTGAGFFSAEPSPRVSLYLAAGKIYRGEEDRLSEIFLRKGWTLWGPSFLRSELEKLRDSAYENTVPTMVAKLLLRGHGPDRRGLAREVPSPEHAHSLVTAKQTDPSSHGFDMRRPVLTAITPADRANQLVEQLVLDLTDGRPTLCTYLAALTILFGYEKYTPGYGAQLIKLATASRRYELDGLGPVHLDTFLVNQTTHTPGDGHWERAPYSRDDWNQMFAGARIIE